MYLLAYNRGTPILRRIEWKPDPSGMFKAPSIAKGSPARLACERSGDVSTLTKDVKFAACIEHLISVGDSAARDYLLAQECPLSKKQIEGLGRRMPPFIQAKLLELQNGGRFDGNPTGAFDTNGWSELRVRLPKFRSTLQHYAVMCENGQQIHLSAIERDQLVTLAKTIANECDVLLKKLRSSNPLGSGKPVEAKPYVPKPLKWSDAWKKLRAVHGVLEKCNRDLNSTHWKKERFPTHADFERVTSIVEVMNESAQQIRLTLVTEMS